MKTETLNLNTASVARDWQPSALSRLEAFFRTPQDVTGLVLRLGLAFAMFPHGAQKALGWFGGMGLTGTLGAFQTYMHIPFLLALAVIAAEFLGSIALALGFFTRLSAFGIGVTMVVAAFKVHLANGFFMNWMGNQKGEGIEYFILALTLALALVLKGGGKWSLDSVIARKVSR
jgi:putative oxidoreductase